MRKSTPEQRQRDSNRKRGRRAAARAEIVGKIRGLVASGYVGTEIADKLGIKATSVAATMWRWKIAPPPRKHVNNGKVDKLRAFIERGWYLDECAKLLGVQEYVIKGMVTRYMLPSPEVRPEAPAPVVDPWPAALSGGRFADDPGAARPEGRWRALRPTMSSANSSMAWAG